MYRYLVSEQEDGQRLDRILNHMFPTAGTSFIYKMLRKKNITVDRKKCEGSHRVKAGDGIEVFFSEETLEKFLAPPLYQRHVRENDGKEAANKQRSAYYGSQNDLIGQGEKAFLSLKEIKILYENEDVLFLDKPSGVLSQKASQTDLSINEWLIGYLVSSGCLDDEKLVRFRPTVCNRLDRNTSGILLCAKTPIGARFLSAALKDRSLTKLYYAPVWGRLDEPISLHGYLKKSERNNQVTITKSEQAGSVPIQTDYRPVAHAVLNDGRPITLLEVHLVTGRSHQIRAHLSSIGHSILGDPKYGDLQQNRKLLSKYGIRSQLLHCCKVTFPFGENSLIPELSGASFESEMPKDMVQFGWQFI